MIFNKKMTVRFDSHGTGQTYTGKVQALVRTRVIRQTEGIDNHACDPFSTDCEKPVQQTRQTTETDSLTGDTRTYGIVYGPEGDPFAKRIDSTRIGKEFDQAA